MDIIHPGLPNVSKADVCTKLGQMYKTDASNVICFGFKTDFGGGRSSGLALIYDTLDAAKKFEPKCRLARVQVNFYSITFAKFPNCRKDLSL